MRFGIFHPETGLWLSPLEQEVFDGRLPGHVGHDHVRWFLRPDYFCKTEEDAESWCAEADRCCGGPHEVRKVGKRRGDQ